MRRTLRIIALAAFAALVAGAPATADEDAEVLIVNGRGTLHLNSSAAVTFQDYFQRKCPLILTAHESGRWVNMLTGPEENCASDSVDYRKYIPTALANCEGGWRYGECWVVAIGREIVWDGRIKAWKGRWTPKSKRQLSVTLSGENANTTSGISTWHTVGMLTYSRSGKSAEIAFKSDPVAGRCKGQLTVVPNKPSPYTVTCSKLGEITGSVDFDTNGVTGIGAGSAKGARHVELRLLPRMDALPKDKVAQNAPLRPRS